MTYQKAHPIRTAAAKKARVAWAKKVLRCQVCGIDREAGRRRDGGLDAECHHIIRGSRSDEPTNWLLVCYRCHGLIHDAVYRDEAGEELPRLTLGVILTVKRLRNPKEYDRQRLEQLFGQTLVDELPLPEFYEREWESRLFKQTKVVKPVKTVKPVKPQVEAKPRGKLKCRRCIRLNLDIDCGNCRAENE